MKRSIIIISLFLLGTTFSVKAQEMTQKEKTNYAIGVMLGKKIAEEIQKSGIDMSIVELIKEKLKEKIDFQFIKEGISDILKGECKLTKEEIEAIFAELEKEKEYFEKLINASQNKGNEVDKGNPLYAELIKEASALYQSREYLKSAQKYAEAFIALEGKEMSCCDRYNAACSYALANEIDSAFVQLFKIANSGSYTNLGHINTDTDLNSLHKDKRWTEVIDIIRNRIYLPRLANNHGSLSWNYLFIKEYTQSEQSARRALELDSSQTWIQVNLAHALLFQNRFSEAEKIYKELSQTIIKDNETYTQTLLKDFDDLEKAGLIPEKHKADVEKIKKMLQE